MKKWEHFMQFTIKPETPIVQQVSNKIIAEIIIGRFAANDKLPSSRALAEFYGVDKKTIERVYRKLCAMKWIFAKNRAGSFVCPVQPVLHGSTVQLVVSEVLRTGYPESLERLQQLNEKAQSSGGSVYFDDSEVYPCPLLNSRVILSSKKFSSEQYKRKLDNAAESLFQTVSLLVQQNGFYHKEEELCMMSGENNVLDTINSALIKEGDVVVMYMPGKTSVYKLFRHRGAEVIPVYGEYESFTGQLAGIAKTRKIKLVYIEPACQYPTTVSFSKEQKLKLLALAVSYDFMVLEANFDNDFWYDITPFESLCLLNRSHVLHLGSVSRLSQHLHTLKYLIGPPKIVEQIKRVWECTGYLDKVQSRVREELIMNSMPVTSGVMIRKECRESSEMMAGLISKYLPEFVSFKKPVAGLGYWLKLKEEQNVHNLYSYLANLGIHIPDPKSYCLPGDNPGGFRLGFAGLREKTAITGMEKIATLLKTTSLN